MTDQIRYQYELSNHSSALRYVEASLLICEKPLNTVFTAPIPLEQARAFLQLRTDLEGLRAAIACDIGDREIALFYGQKQFSFQEQLAAGQKTAEFAHTCFVSGRVLIMTGQYAVAGTTLGRGAEMLRSLPNFNKLRLFSLFYGRGWIHYLQGEYPQATRYFRKALKDRVEAFGEEDREALQ